MGTEEGTSLRARGPDPPRARHQKSSLLHRFHL